MMDRPRYENEVIPEDIPLDIVYEDKYLMVVNKPDVYKRQGRCRARSSWSAGRLRSWLPDFR